MGRGRQKAKHTKVARELKYFSPDTNYGALERELTGGTHSGSHGSSSDDASKWSEYDTPGDDLVDHYATDED